jgi:hypothetical protein
MVLSVNHDGYHVPARYIGWYLLYYLALFSIPANVSMAGRLETLSITEKDGEYETLIVALLDAPSEYVYDVITDYRHIYRINPSIVESELLPARNEGTVRVRNRFEHCIAVFCFEVEMVEDVVEDGNGLLVAKIVPELSSFASGTAVWQVCPYEKGRAWVRYWARVKPNFFIPPVIGRLIIMSRLRKEFTTSFTKIECHAKIIARNTVRDMPVRVAERSADDAGCAG